MSESFVEEYALRVLFKGRGEHGRGGDSCGEVQRRGGGKHVAEMNAQVDS
jgi:hypothetical protein